MTCEIAMPDKLVTIATFSYAEEAYLSKAKLQSEGIWCFVADEGIGTQIGSIAIGGVKLQVREYDVPKAMRILGIQK